MRGHSINLNIFMIWVYKTLSKFPVTIEWIFKKVVAESHQIDVENSSTIEESKIFFQKGYTNTYVSFQYY